MSGFGPCNIFIDTVYGKITYHTLSTGYILHDVLLRLLVDCSKHTFIIWFTKLHNTSTITKLTNAFLWPKKQPNN
jgi:intein-encoded DNA endonuclease-like protein